MPRGKKTQTPAYFLGICLLGGVLLRVYMLDSKPLWGDEIEFYWVTQKSVKSIFEYLLHFDHPVHPPLYYLIINSVLRIQTTVFTARMPSAIAGAFLIPLIYAITREFFSDCESSKIAALLVTVSPLLIIVSQLARPYALLIVLTQASLLFYWRALKRNETSSWYGFTITNLLAIYLHYYAMFFLMAEVVFYFFVFRDLREYRRFLKSLATISIIYLPWAWHLLGQVGGEPLRMYPSIIKVLSYTIYKYPIGLRRITLVDWRIVALLTIPFFYIVAFRGAYASLKTHRMETKLLLTCLFVSPLFPSIIHFFTPILDTRYLWFLCPIVFTFLARGISTIKNNVIKVGLIGGILLLYAFLLYDYYFLINSEGWELLVGV